GTHWLDLVQFVTGSHITSVCADLQTVHPVRQRPTGGVETFSGKLTAAVETHDVPITTDDAGSILLHFANGAKGSMWVSQVTAGRKNCVRFEIAAATGSVAWESERPNELWIGQRDTANQSLIRDPALLGLDARRIAQYPGGHNEGFPDSFKQLFRTFYGYIAAGDFTAPRPFPTFADGHREILLCEAILKSHRERRWIDVEESTT
ncbi:MAG TPA: Gfo/Idh/MocA family oxidoreductase, partial [Pirellulaceae bacterium]|nr:Gfo/Idh/MocA family oxidoreductase [Pirellulaceae bacterium]